MAVSLLESLFIKYPAGLMSRGRRFFYRIVGMKIGTGNCFEQGKFRRASQIKIGNNNAFTEGYKLWPLNEDYSGKRIVIGDNNYFNKGLMIDACGLIIIGNKNMFG